MTKEQDVTEDSEVSPEDVLNDTEHEESEQSESAPASAEADLQRKLEDASTRADENWEQLVRAKAEMENLRKRQTRELENAHKYALERFATELLAVRDSMELGVAAAQADGADVEKLREGTELTLKLFSDAMDRFNVQQIDPAGEPFDPELHQAMTLQPNSELPPNTVLSVVQKGYTLNERLIRPAMVIVSKAGDEKIDEKA